MKNNFPAKLEFTEKEYAFFLKMHKDSLKSFTRFYNRLKKKRKNEPESNATRGAKKFFEFNVRCMEAIIENPNIVFAKLNSERALFVYRTIIELEDSDMRKDKLVKKEIMAKLKEQLRRRTKNKKS